MAQTVTIGAKGISVLYDPISGVCRVTAEGQNPNDSVFEIAPFNIYAHQLPMLQTAILQWYAEYKTNHPDNSAPTKEEVAQLLATGFVILGTAAPAPQPETPITTTAPDFLVSVTLP